MLLIMNLDYEFQDIMEMLDDALDNLLDDLEEHMLTLELNDEFVL